jgi:preprotein translocase subunit YajC
METITNLLLIIIMSLAVYGLFVSIRQGKRAEKRGEMLLKTLLRDIEEEKDDKD